MPLWMIHHTPGLISDEQKRELSARITDHYEKAGLPRFYVITIFNEIRPEDFHVGGEPTPVGLRVVIDHIARRAADKADRQRIARWINWLMTPFVEAHPDLHWEFHVDETSEDLWMINGIAPPPGGSDAEKAWAQANAVSAY
ncbi:tautomerase family protein [Mycobacterium asiaticum]|uniref:4-oxalocrotonate tautomerase n=1 Tax=Mycobacterium asiaticum TaxID=1790 RepID=A0A1A3KGM2_MYCAS|nr:tautomerase family protein [Mycobacterium asiaticum]OBJ83553.1 4-oxalocrotonate tautomerase [Mycobacterium asiaticum]